MEKSGGIRRIVMEAEGRGAMWDKKEAKGKKGKVKERKERRWKERRERN